MCGIFQAVAVHLSCQIGSCTLAFSLNASTLSDPMLRLWKDGRGRGPRSPRCQTLPLGEQAAAGPSGPASWLGSLESKVLNGRLGGERLSDTVVFTFLQATAEAITLHLLSSCITAAFQERGEISHWNSPAFLSTTLWEYHCQPPSYYTSVPLYFYLNLEQWCRFYLFLHFLSSHMFAGLCSFLLSWLLPLNE